MGHRGNGFNGEWYQRTNGKRGYADRYERPVDRTPGPAAPELRVGTPGAHLAARRAVSPVTKNQATYLEAIRDSAVTICDGPAGCGKTFLAVGEAVHSLLERGNNGAIKKILLVRPAVEAGEHLGFLPGDGQLKVKPYMRPVLDAVREFSRDEEEYRHLVNPKSNLIEIMPIAYMRGCTFHNHYMILDEAQNTTPKQMIMFMTRMGKNSKMVVTGDTTQVDLESSTPSGLGFAFERFERRLRHGGFRTGRAAVTRMGRCDIQRNEFIAEIIETLEGEQDVAGRCTGRCVRGTPTAEP